MVSKVTQGLIVYIETNDAITLRKWVILAQHVYRENKMQRLMNKKVKKKIRQTHGIDATISNSSDEEFDARHNHAYHTAGSQGIIKKLTTTLRLDGFEILMEIDTGTEHSTIPFSLYKAKLGCVKLEPSTVKLCQYDGMPLERRD